MRSLLLLTLSAFLVATSAQAQDDAEKLRGTWTVVAAQKSGNKVPPDVLKLMKVTIGANTIVIAQGDQPGESATFKLDPSKKPKTIDITPPKNANDKTVVGIYELDGDTLKFVWNKEGGERPKAIIESSEDRDLTILILKREKK